jgi:hypothetical protein
VALSTCFTLWLESEECNMSGSPCDGCAVMLLHCEQHHSDGVVLWQHINQYTSISYHHVTVTVATQPMLTAVYPIIMIQ